MQVLLAQMEVVHHCLEPRTHWIIPGLLDNLVAGVKYGRMSISQLSHGMNPSTDRHKTWQPADKICMCMLDSTVVQPVYIVCPWSQAAANMQRMGLNVGCLLASQTIWQLLHSYYASVTGITASVLRYSWAGLQYVNIMCWPAVFGTG